jgi:hypothetical protein
MCLAVKLISDLIAYLDCPFEVLMRGQRTRGSHSRHDLGVSVLCLFHGCL